MIMKRRASGVLLHITSLPSNFGIGDLGPRAYKFADLLSEMKQSYWQVLPLTPTSLQYGNSPYNTSSGFAGNTLLISPEILVREKLLPDRIIDDLPALPSERVDYKAVSGIKKEMIKKAYESFRRKVRDYSHEFEAFCDENSKWLDDYALYKALREETGRPWYLWSRYLRDGQKEALAEKRKSLKDLIDLENFSQFVFFRQWFSLREYCRRKGISIIGDLPFYASYDSADLWINSKIFKLNKKKRPLFIGGVPPDYFSDKGQLWGNPVYDWEQLEATDFEWWMDRIEHNLKLFDVLRLDHFRGFLAYWEVPAYEKTAVNGRWVETPSKEFFNILVKKFPNLPFIAEDLGVITADVREVMNKFDIPGMVVLLFAFNGSSDNAYLPHNHSQNSLVVTGTHDTNTVRGWFVKEASPKERNMLFKYVGKKLSEKEVSWKFIRLAMMSVASLGIIPMQDILSLGAEARMNHPAISVNNWEWRVTKEQLMHNELRRFREMTETFGRC